MAIAHFPVSGRLKIELLLVGMQLICWHNNRNNRALVDLSIVPAQWNLQHNGFMVPTVQTILYKTRV